MSGSVRTEMGEVVVGSSSGDKRAFRTVEVRGMDGGVPSSDSGGSSDGAVVAGGKRDGLAWRRLWFSAMIRSTSPSSGVLSRVRVCLLTAAFFGVGGLAGAVEDSAAEATMSKFDAEAEAEPPRFCASESPAFASVVAEVAASLPFLDLADRLLRLMLGLDAAKCAAMPLLGAMTASTAWLASKRYPDPAPGL